MKSTPTLLQDASDDDIFGPPRTYSSSYYSTNRQRPSMISAKYRQKEERRKVLKISVNKLRKIEDPENSLCRSVLINNTMKRLQRETKEEKINNQNQQTKKSIMTEFAKLEPDTDLIEQKKSPITTDFATFNDDLVQPEVKRTSEDLLQPEVTTPYLNGSRKRSADEVDDCDVQDVLSQFYMPPTPRMLTSIDDDEDLLPEIKRAKFETDRTDRLNNDETNDDARANNNKIDRLSDDYVSEMKRTKYEDRLNEETNSKHAASSISSISQIASQVTVPVTTASSFSCGHSSIFNDLQNNVFHSLVASLET